MTLEEDRARLDEELAQLRRDAAALVRQTRRLAIWSFLLACAAVAFAVWSILRTVL
jgi:type VI protein secretion system component VasF